MVPRREPKPRRFSKDKTIRFILKTYLWLWALPYALILLGAASNQIVLVANHGKFPVMMNSVQAREATPDGMLDRYHCLMTEDTHLNAMADIFKLGPAIESIGDLSLDLADFIQPFTLAAWATLVIRKLAGYGIVHEAGRA